MCQGQRDSSWFTSSLENRVPPLPWQGHGSWLAIELPETVALSGLTIAFEDGTERQQFLNIIYIDTEEVRNYSSPNPKGLLSVCMCICMRKSLNGWMHIYILKQHNYSRRIPNNFWWLGTKTCCFQRFLNCASSIQSNAQNHLGVVPVLSRPKIQGINKGPLLN